MLLFFYRIHTTPMGSKPIKLAQNKPDRMITIQHLFEQLLRSPCGRLAAKSRQARL